MRVEIKITEKNVREGTQGAYIRGSNLACHIRVGPSNLYIKLLLLLLLLLIFDMDVSCHMPFLPGTSLEPAVIPTAHASSFTLQYFPYYV